MKNLVTNSKLQWVQKQLKSFLKQIDLEEETECLKEELKTAQGQRRTRAIKRLEVVESFRNSGNKPEWMILRCTTGYSTRTYVQWFN